MNPFTKLTAVAAPLDMANIDTDKIIPARYLRKPREPGYDPYLFYDMRFDAEGRERADFVLNQPAYRKAGILVYCPTNRCIYYSDSVMLMHAPNKPSCDACGS